MKLGNTRARRALARDARGERAALFLLTSLLLAFCVSTASCNRRPDDYVQFRKLPLETQNAEFKRLPIDKQIDYYLYNRGRDLPTMTFDDAIASQGEAVLPDLLRRLKAEPAEYRQCDLMSLFVKMHRNYVPLNEKRQVINTLELVVARMKDRDWKDMSQKSLELVKASPDTPIPRPSPLSVINR